MSIALYLDEDVDPLLAQVLRDRGFDCVSAREARNLGRSDREQLAIASSQKRAILTFNVRDFVRLAAECILSGRHHAGIIVSDHLPFRELLRRMLALLQRHPQTDLTDTLLWLHDYKEVDVN
jgi:predicted nuclease of predicted toxin-antitoxin system